MFGALLLLNLRFILVVDCCYASDDARFIIELHANL